MMELEFESPEKHIREIEDIIDIQKANGSLTTRQVGFSLPPPVEGEGGGERGAGGRKQWRPRRAERRAGSPAAAAAADGVSWPSDSDITVLRVAQRAGAACSGDGSSMVNLATLVQPSRPASKHSLLLPLSSWTATPPAPTPFAPPEPPEPRKARLARFLRLYFCPCCTCLYEMERHPRRPPDAPAPDTPYMYFTAR